MPNLLALQAVVFDLDGTLLDRRLSFERFMRGQWERFSRVLQSVDQAEYVRTVIALDCDGYAPRKVLFAGTLAHFELPSELAETLLQDYRDGFPSACVLFPDAAHTLLSLRAAGLRLGLITNGSVRMQSSKLKCLALASAFETVLISDAEGVSKPDPEIFRRALERLSASPEHAVFVGDHPDVDVSGARRAGMKAVWRRDRALSRTVEADAIIDELGELLSLLGLERHDGPAGAQTTDTINE
ncbi:MAG: HAD family hydrolase [Thermoanaerobaculia bacterium]